MSDPLIAAALRPLSGDSESRFSARMLLETLREEHTDQAQDALKRWDAHDKKKRRLSWRAVFMILAAVISAVMLTPGVLDFMDYRRILRAASGYEFDDAAKVFDLTRFTTRDKQLLKISDAGQSRRISRTTTKHSLPTSWRKPAASLRTTPFSPIGRRESKPRTRRKYARSPRPRAHPAQPRSGM